MYQRITKYPCYTLTGTNILNHTEYQLFAAHCINVVVFGTFLRLMCKTEKATIALNLLQKAKITEPYLWPSEPEFPKFVYCKIRTDRDFS